MKSYELKNLHESFKNLLLCYVMHPTHSIADFQSFLECSIESINKKKTGTLFICGNLNTDLLKSDINYRIMLQNLDALYQYIA